MTSIRVICRRNGIFCERDPHRCIEKNGLGPTTWYVEFYHAPILYIDIVRTVLLEVKIDGSFVGYAAGDDFTDNSESDDKILFLLFCPHVSHQSSSPKNILIDHFDL